MPTPRAGREQRRDHVVLVGDIGGTFARFALARDGTLLNPPQRLERGQWPDLTAACRHYLVEHGDRLRIDGVSIAAAGRFQDGRIAMTNAAWSVDPAVLAADLGVRTEQVAVLNDFGALAWALPALSAEELIPVPATGPAGTVAGRADGNRVVVGPGTGLGVAALLRTGTGWHPLPTEGGHVSCAAETPLEQAALALAAGRFGRVSWERVLSGPGLALVHEAARREAGLAPDGADAAGVVERCARGDPAALRAARTFVEWLGAFAGDLAMLYDAAGGVVVAGGVVPRIGAVLPLDTVRRRFESKGRFEPWLRTVPLDLLAAPFAALQGAAIAYRNLPPPLPR